MHQRLFAGKLIERFLVKILFSISCVSTLSSFRGTEFAFAQIPVRKDGGKKGSPSILLYPFSAPQSGMGICGELEMREKGAHCSEAANSSQGPVVKKWYVSQESYEFRECVECRKVTL